MLNNVSIKEVYYSEASKFSMAQWLQLVDPAINASISSPVLRRVMSLGSVPASCRIEAAIEILDSSQTLRTVKTRVRIYGRHDGAKTTELITAVVEVPGVGEKFDDANQATKALVASVVWSSLAWKATIQGSSVVGYHQIKDVGDLLELDNQLATGWFVDVCPPAGRREHVALKIEAFSLRIQPAGG